MSPTQSPTQPPTSSASPTRIHLVDASPFIFRAYFSLPSSMKAPDGRPVNAVYGFASTVLKMIDDESLTHAAFAFDRSLTTSFRNEIYPEYKQQRELPPEDLERQLEDCERLIAALGFCHCASERFEADDLIGTLVDRLLGASDHDLVVVSSDKDLGQLVNERVSFYDLAKGQHLDAAAVQEKLGVPPHLVPDFLGLAGDPVDNIPGVPGIGKKSASALLLGLGSLDEVYADLDAVEQLSVRGAKSLRRKLEEHREQAEMSKQLATLASDAPLDGLTDGKDASPEALAGALAWKGADRVAFESLAHELGFGDRLLSRVQRFRD